MFGRECRDCFVVLFYENKVHGGSNPFVHCRVLVFYFDIIIIGVAILRNPQQSSTSPRRNTQYVSRAATSVRGALKEPAKRKAMAQENFSYNASAWEAGVQGKKTQIQSLAEAGSV